MALAYQAPTTFRQPLIQRDRYSRQPTHSVGWMPQVPRRAQGVRSTGVVRMQVGDAGSAPRGQSSSRCSEIEDDDGISDALSLLQQQIKVYTANEDYKMAAKVRDAIQQLEMRDPLKLLERELQDAIAEQRFQDAARCRDELKVLTPPPKAAPGLAAVMTKSEVITKGIRVETRCVYVRERSHPDCNHFFFAYRIRIINEGQEAVQLLRRHWEIRDTNGRVEHVRGPGVVGTQPILQPNTGFEYTSACPLATPCGTMEGDYEMVYPDHLERGTFQVKIAKFDLDVKDEGSL